VSILNRDRQTLASNDDAGSTQNARIGEFIVPVTGAYYIRAARYSGAAGPTNTEGSFVLVLARRFN
jgi:hypothetical protein